MKTVLTLAILALSVAAQAESPAQIAASKAVSQLAEIQANRANYEIKTFQSQPVGDYLLHDCMTGLRGLELFLRDAPMTAPNTFVQTSPYDSTQLVLIPAHSDTFDNLKVRFKGIESGFDFKRTAPGDADSGELTLSEVSMRVWKAPNMKTQVYLNCLRDYAPTNGYRD